MSQPPVGGGGGGQRSGTPQPFYIPTLMSSLQQQPQQQPVISGSGPVSSSSFYPPTLMTSLQQQQSVVITASGTAVAPVITSSSFISPGIPPAVAPTSVSVIQQPLTTANLYLCATSKNATEVSAQDGDSDTKKTSIEMLEESYKQLNARKVKDSLSSFLPDVPGEFDSMDSPETKLQHLLEQRVIGNKEFHPLSGHALLGFRLLPGPLPEQYRIDPPMQETRSNHRKKKHKHKNIEKVGDEGSDLNAPSSKVKVPADAYSFMKDASLVHVYAATDRTIAPKVMAPGHGYPPTLTPTPTVVGGSSLDPLSVLKKKKKAKKEKKKDKKEKKKKKDKHHGQEPPVGPSGAPQSTGHQHPHSHGIL